MKVMKFGGTSIGQPQRMKEVADLVTTDPEPKIVVLSALSGTTNALIEISGLLANNDTKSAKQKIISLHQHYEKFIAELFSDASTISKANEVISEHFEFLSIILKISFSEALNKDILAQGELLSTKLFSLCLEEKKADHKLLPALDFMTLDSHDEPLTGAIKVKLAQLIAAHPEIPLFVTQGYITRNAKGEVDNLKRGGSDYSASLIAAAVSASVCEIWTDIDGMHNNDPRLVEKTKPVEQLSFDEAAELAYFGAKILHPASIWPAQYANVPVRLLNTHNPKAKGTIIQSDAASVGVKAIAAKDNITAIKIKSSRMLLAYGFLRKVFEIFEKHRTAIDMITTSEIALSLTVDNDQYLPEILKELEQLGMVEIDKDQTIVAIVGNEIGQTKEIMHRLFETISTIPVRMVSYGGSRHNISLLIPKEHKVQTLKLLNKGLFGLE
jgi:aspartate kinase